MEEKRKIETFKVVELKNGIRTVIVPIKGLRALTVEAFVKIGSKYEQDGEYGLSHFLEHMAFKGTQKRPSAIDVNNEIDAKGAMYNAGTNQEMTSYYITTVRENTEWAVEILSDILLNAKLDGVEVEKERGVICEEIRMYQDNPMMGLSGDFTKFILNGSSGCWNISGEVEDIVKVNRSDVFNYREKYINPKDMVVVLAGDVDIEAIDLVKKYFENFKNQNSRQLPDVKIKWNDTKEMVRNKDIEQGHFCVGVPGVSWKDERRYALKILDIVLAGNTSSRLYNKIREEKAWAYYVVSVGDSFLETGFWAVQSGVKQDRVYEAVKLVKEEMLSIGSNITEKEINRAKEYLNGKTKLAMDRSDFWSTYLGQKVLLEGKAEKLEDELKRYSLVGIEDVKKIAKELFSKDRIRSLIVTRI